jgi:hypothetical protein
VLNVRRKGKKMWLSEAILFLLLVLPNYRRQVQPLQSSVVKHFLVRDSVEIILFSIYIYTEETMLSCPVTSL